MSNSSLVSYTKLSPNRTRPRNHNIDTITIHCVVGQLSVEQILNLSNFTNYDGENGASCNYAIGSDGRIGLCVNESDRSWCSSNRNNDHRAITIECASDTTSPYAVNNRVYNSLIKLSVDICKRNGVKKLLWKADKSLVGQVDKQNMTVHRWFANKSCPGDYLYDLHGQIAKEVNTMLESEGNKVNFDEVVKSMKELGYAKCSKTDNTVTFTKEVKPLKSIDTIVREVIAGDWGNGQYRIDALTEAGYDHKTVQAKVGEILNQKKPQKSVREIAGEVIQGKWGNGEERKSKLADAGYDYKEVQSMVNKII